ncbi:hypothetical protein GCM10009554_06540 [Kribbella koreensis]|uniref:Uncharacterized protein n=1 Tax=Kribbella koreensis TaxID=57909 RepID=A0ABP3ZU19_9ACTN
MPSLYGQDCFADAPHTGDDEEHAQVVGLGEGAHHLVQLALAGGEVGNRLGEFPWDRWRGQRLLLWDNTRCPDGGQKILLRGRWEFQGSTDGVDGLGAWPAAGSSLQQADGLLTDSGELGQGGLGQPGFQSMAAQKLAELDCHPIHLPVARLREASVRQL